MMKTLKMGLLGLAVGVVGAVVLPSPVAMAGDGGAVGGGQGSTCPLAKYLCVQSCNSDFVCTLGCYYKYNC